MLDLSTFIEIIGETMLGGNMMIAGAVLLVGILAFIMAITKKPLITMVLALPLIMIWAVMGFLPSEIGIMMLIVVALGIGIEAREFYA